MTTIQLLKTGVYFSDWSVFISWRQTFGTNKRKTRSLQFLVKCSSLC